MTRLGGLQIYTDDRLVKYQQYSRSRARAKRRAKQGHRQHFAWLPIPGAVTMGNFVLMHPAELEKLKRMCEVK